MSITEQKGTISVKGLAYIGLICAGAYLGPMVIERAPSSCGALAWRMFYLMATDEQKASESDTFRDTIVSREAKQPLPEQLACTFDYWHGIIMPDFLNKKLQER